MTASSLAVQWLAPGDGIGVQPHDVAADASTTLVSKTSPNTDGDPEQSAQLARIAFVAPEALPLRLETFADVDEVRGNAEQPAWTGATVIDAEEDPAPETSQGWQNGMRVDKSPSAARTLPVTGERIIALPPVTVARTHKAALQLPGERSASLSERLAEIAPGASARLAQKFQASGVAWPPAEATLVAVKNARTLELHARASGGAWTLVHSYPVLAASGGAGPKLRKGDRQVPEGIYKISFLNPNSKFHVSLRVDYPNAFDRQMAARDGRKELGGDIMIHGKAVSSGCLAVGDAAAEELFVLAERIGVAQVKLVIAPADFRRDGIPPQKAGDPPWLAGLYAQVAAEMAAYKAPATGGIASGLLSFFGN